MLKTLFHHFPFLRPAPRPPRRVRVESLLANEAGYDALFNRLQSLNLPERECRRRQALDVLSDPMTGREWELVIVEDGPVPLMGLNAYENR